MKNLLLITTALVAFNANAQTRPTVTITGSSHVPVELPKVGSSVSLITADEIEARGITQLNDALQALPGVQVNRSGGGLSQIRIRGAEGKHALVIIDGVQYNDVGQGEAYLDLFPVADIERIEVVRGPQSGIWGAAAHAGAVIITTKTGKFTKKPALQAAFEIGSLNTQRITLSAQGSQGKVYGATTIDANRTKGWNIADNGYEKDGNGSFAITQKLGVDVNDRLNFEGFFRHQQKSDKYDVQGFTGLSEVIDSDNKSDQRNSLLKLAATYKALEGKWVHSLSFDSNIQERKDFDTGLLNFSNAGSRVGFTYKNAFRFGDTVKQTLVTGIQKQAENYKYQDNYNSEWVNGKTRQRTGIFAEYLADFKQGTAVSAAARYDYNSNFENIATWRLTAAHSFAGTGTRLHTSLGKGSTNPTFFQQYGYYPANFVGNASIRPEQSLGFDAGFEQKWFGGKLITDITYFKLALSDAIGTKYNSNFEEYAYNSTRTLHRHGVEFAASALLTNWLSLNGSYTYFDGLDDKGLAVVRRPNNAASLSAVMKMFDDKGRFTISLNHNGKMRDNAFNMDSFTNDSVSLKPFTVLNAQFSYDISKTTTAYVRGENLLNTKYQEVYSFKAAPMQVFAGVRVKLGE